MFTLGCEDTRGEIHAQLGGSVVSCLRTRKVARAQVLPMCRRLIQRIDDPRKNWKFSAADIRERKFWPPHRKAYQACLTETCTVGCIALVPADDKNNTR